MIKTEFYESKKAINLKDVDVSTIVVSNKIRANDETSKVFIACLDDASDIITPLCIILPVMSR